MTEQQYRTIANREVGDGDPRAIDIRPGDRVTFGSSQGAGLPVVVRIERPVPTEHCLSTAHHTAHEWGGHDGQTATGYWCPGFNDPEPSVPTREQIAPLPDDARMEAYYYGFERTGVGFIDAILSAVATAGKGAHHTESWWTDDEYGYYRGRPGLPDADNAVDLIQKAAQQAADAVLALIQKEADR